MADRMKLSEVAKRKDAKKTSVVTVLPPRKTSVSYIQRSLTPNARAELKHNLTLRLHSLQARRQSPQAPPSGRALIMIEGCPPPPPRIDGRKTSAEFKRPVKRRPGTLRAFAHRP